MSWLLSWWTKPALKVQDPENSRRGKSDTWAGRDVGPNGAMQLSAFWSCVRLNSETISTLPLGMYEKQRDGSKAPAEGHVLYGVLHDSPNADQTAAEFWEGQVISLCIFGNAYSLKDKREDGSIISLTPLSAAPGDMQRKRDDKGVLRYSFTHRGKRYVGLTEDDVFHIRGFGDDGNGGGLSVIAFARQSLSISEAIAASAGATFRNGMKSSIFFTSPPGVKMDQTQRNDFRKAFIDPYVGGEATNAGLLEQGFDVKTVSLPPKDAEMLLTWRFSIEEICRWLRVPPVLIGHSADGQTMWGSGIEQIMLGWLTLGLRPYLTRIEQAIKKRLVLPKERGRIFAEFNVEGLLRADSAGRASLLSSLVQNGLMTRNEGRALDNRQRMDGGDVLTVQSNLVPIDMLGKLPPKAVQPAPGEPVP
ncbi:phage portal protein [Bradyrhizobium liaoningense]|uniref:phage portal protein n=1 Tax=Bradyrhizobium liaoningense TaxID=43992 RepID=UPI001BA741FA|nr:phage portal protein [Bradyrhizobium liaoningense]MBR0855656.1 phage portal protein [Bradyrhizobium liaoningense]